MGYDTVDYLLDSRLDPAHIESAYESVASDALDLVAQRFDEAQPYRELRLHGDCHPGNVLWTEAGPHFVDLDDCMTGPAIQDLWMLLSGRPEEMRAQLDDILDGYAEFARFRRARDDADRAAAHAAHHPLRGLAGAPLGRPGVSRALFRGSRNRSTGSSTCSNLREQMAAMEEEF